MSQETLHFGMHENLLFDVILKQAGTLQKAIMEGVMNAIDAGATACHVELDTTSFSISDDGHGFQSKDDIKELFAIFGTPHQEGDATYGRFRIGRGQIMAFGSNSWRSRHFEMRDIDIKNKGLKWTLIEHAEDHKGTRVDVDLYEALIPSDLERIKSEVRQFVAWSQVPVYLNGDLISKHPSEGKWDHEDETAYYSLSAERNQLAIYNLGVLVSHFWAGRFGMGGIVISKKPLEVNFARNDVISTCPVGKAIAGFIKAQANKGIKKKSRLTDGERDLLVKDFLAGELDMQTAVKLRGLSDVTGRTWPIDKLMQIPNRFGGKLAVAERGDLMLETAQRQGIAFTVDEATLERFGVSDGKALLDRIALAARSVLRKSEDDHSRFYGERYTLQQIADDLPSRITVVARNDLSAFVSADHIALSEKEMTPERKTMLQAIERGYMLLLQALNRAQYEDRRFEYRQLKLGRSETAYAWTDGKQTIWIDIEHARALRRGMTGAYQIAGTLLHEMLHEGPDTGTHQHDLPFYQAYHDISGLPQDPLGLAAERMVKIFIAKLRQNKKKLSQHLLKQDDNDAMIETLRAEIEDQA